MEKRILLAIGNEEIENQIRKLKDVEVVDSDSDISIIADILNYEQIDFVIANTILSSKKSIDLAHVAKEKGIKIIAIVEDKNDKDLIPALVGAGVYAFAAPDELFLLQGFLDEYPEGFDFKNFVPGGKGRNSGEGGPGIMAPSRKAKTTVAVMGCMDRIGTTTQALRMTKFLVDRGFKACYIEANKHNYVNDLFQAYSDTTKDEALGKITYKDVDMFCETSELAKIVRLPYQYFVYDYGNFQEIAQDMSWKEKDIHILCAGTKPNELIHLQPAFDMLPGKAKYIYVFSHESEHADVRGGMCDAAGDTFFAGYAPDPFRGDEDFYEKILELPIVNAGKPVKVATEKKNWFFGRRKKE